MLTLDDATADELRDKLYSLTHHWSPSDNSSDYVCEFCYQRADTNHGPITHTDTCFGMKLLKLANDEYFNRED